MTLFNGLIQRPYPSIARNFVYSAPHMQNHASKKYIEGAYKVLKRDLVKLFEYIEPENDNLHSYSHRTFELLMRGAIEFESLSKMVFINNNVLLQRREENIIRYSDLEGVLFLSRYKVHCIYCPDVTLLPFDAFNNINRRDRSPDWYRSYNSAKHDRIANFRDASLINVIESIAAVFIMVNAQLGVNFDSIAGVARENPDGFITLPSYFDLFELNENPLWQPQEMYAYFDWAALESSGNPYDYCPIPTRL